MEQKPCPPCDCACVRVCTYPRGQPRRRCRSGCRFLAGAHVRTSVGTRGRTCKRSHGPTSRPSSPTAAVWARAFRFEQRCPFVPSLQPGYVRACVRTLHTRGRGRPEDLRMPWIGVVLRRWTNVDQTSCGVRSTVHCCPEFCVEFDIKRKAWELPKGGVQPSRDTSPYATARRELWEEAGVWLQWRERGTSTWASPKGDVLGEAPSADKHAWLVTDVLPYDEIDLRRPPMWMSLARFRQISPRDDHVKVLETVALLQHCKMKTVHLQANERGGPPW